MSDPPSSPLTIWCNSLYPEPAMRLLIDGTRRHRFIHAPRQSNLKAPAADTRLESADVVLGQPDVGQVISLTRLRWIHLDSAGYTRYDRDDVRKAVSARGGVMTNSSAVYDEPCAQHLLAIMLANARQIPQSVLNQHGPRAWPYVECRRNSHLLGGQTVLILGFGSIAKRLVELLQPLGMNIVATRRKPRGDEAVRIEPESRTDELLPSADHVIDILPDNPGTIGYFDAKRFSRMKPSATFYNIGRGTTVNQPALIAALTERQIAGAYLDVTDPEPLPPEHALWRVPNCFITPHTGGGHANEFERLIGLFLENLEHFIAGEPLKGRIV
jgi:phosphoglycerate dehydrogenase-like enzyme